MKNRYLVAFLIGLCLSLFAFAASDGFIVAFKDAPSAAQGLQFLEDAGVAASRVHDSVDWYVVPDKETADALEKQGLLEFFEENTVIPLPKIEPTRDAMLFSMLYSQWSHEATGAAAAWKLGVTGKGRLVTVIDSGADETHEDLAGAIAGGYNYYAKTGDFSDTRGHGTMVTGFIAARRNEFGVTGLANEGNVFVAKNINDEGGIPLSSAAGALLEAFTERDSDVVNMSFGINSPSAVLYSAIRQADAAGVILVAASGNDGDLTYDEDGKPQYVYDYPASYDQVISVSNVKRLSDGTLTRFGGPKGSGSTSNPAVFIAAPGGSVRSTYPSNLNPANLYRTGSGTSYASPYVAAAALLCRDVDPAVTPDHFKELLASTADKTILDGNERTDDYGYGFINVENLILTLLDEHCDCLCVGPFYHDFADGSDSVTVYNASDDPLPLACTAVLENADGDVLASHAAVLDPLSPGELRTYDAAVFFNVEDYSLLADTGTPRVTFFSESRGDLSVSTYVREEGDERYYTAVRNDKDEPVRLFLAAAAYDESGRVTGTAVSPLTTLGGGDHLRLDTTALMEGPTVKTFVLDENLAPLCSPLIYRDPQSE